MSGSGAWLLLVLLILDFVGTSDSLYSEIVVPRILRTHAMKEKSYLIVIEGKSRILHLHQQSFIFRNMPIYTFDPNKNRQENHPHIKVDCYYSGSVEDVPDSDVALSTCAGLWGYIHIGSLKYEIHPVEFSLGFQHLIYQTNSERHAPCKGTVEGKDDLRNMDIQQRETEVAVISGKATEFPGPNSPSRYLEYFAVCDNAMFQREKQNITRVIQAVLQIVFILHHIYDDMGLHVVLTGIEIWSRQNYLAFSDKLNETLYAFYNYVSTELQHYVHFDHASLFMIVNEDYFYGKSWREHLCLHNQVSVSAVKILPSLIKNGISAAHQLGHAIGFAHDDMLVYRGQHCDCKCSSNPGHCLMHSAVIECYRLSNCSKNAYFTFLAQHGKKCFLNLPKDQSVTMMCGNGVVEGGEECDCGMDEECRKKGCCLQNCKRKAGANCHYGHCCEECKITNEGKLCREAATECDLPEYCTGNSAMCPANVYKQDGVPCGNGNRCYLGRCFDLQQHCKALFGKDAKLAPLGCFKSVNMRGDRTGNCGKSKSGYKKCKEEDVLCGRIQCINVKKIPVTSTQQGVVQTPMDNVLCLGTEFHDNEDVYDIGAVQNGSMCGTDKICVNRACVNQTILNYDCDFSKCSNQGVCNSNKNCHCAYGWAPPDCSTRGFGGSIDSGPPPERVKYKKTLMLGSILGVGLLLLALSIMMRKYIYLWFRIAKNVLTEPPDFETEVESAAENSGSATEGSTAEG